MRKYLWWIIFGAAVALLAAWQWRQSGKPTEVQVAEARSGPLIVEWSAVGYVEARTAQVTAPQVGRIDRVLVREGDRVRAGQTLANLSRQIEEAGVDVQRAGVSLASAQVEAARAAVREAEATQDDRERKARADTSAARERWRQAAALYERSKKTLPAHVQAARSELQALRSTLKDLERGSRPEEISQAEAELRAAEATLRRSRTEVERQKQLYADGATAKRDLDNAEEALARAEAAASARLEALALLRRGAREDQIATARARVHAAEASLSASEGELAGLQAEARKVSEAESALRAARAAEAEVRSARTRIQTLREETRAAEARLGQSRAAVEQASAGLTERAVIAPFSGTVGRRYVDPGDMATPNQPLFSVVEIGESWVAAEVDEQDLAPVREGQAVAVTAPAYVGREFPGKVARIGGEAVPQTEVRTCAHIVRIRISLAPTPAADRALLKPGMEVHASGKATLAKQVILVPSDTLLTDAEGSYVWVVDAGKARKRRVKSGYMNGPETEIVSGLRQGERVVVSGKENLQEGQAVEPKPRTGES